MKAPNKYITIIFILALTYAVYNLAAPSGKKILDSKANENKKLSPVELELAEAFKEKSGPEKDLDNRDLRKMLPYGTDPFLFPEGMHPYNKKKINKKAARRPVKRREKVVKRKEKPLSLKVTSILISEDQKVATIDQAPYVVTIGDWIENEQVLEITPDRVILGKNGKKVEILLKSQPRSSKKHRGRNES